VEGFNIRLFGEIVIEHDGAPVAAPPAKSMELLCYLLLGRHQVHTREELSNVLWPDAPPVASKRYLRQALWRLNATLRHDAEGAGALLTVDAAFVRVSAEAPFWVDVGAFESAHASFHSIPGERLDDEQARSLDSAIELYRGELLPTWYQDWCIYERERLHLIRIMMLEQLMAHCESRQRFARAIGYGQTILRHDRARERTHRELMRLYYLIGDRTAAMRQYERCVRALAVEFGLQPDSKTSAMHQQIRADQLERTGERPVGSGALERPQVDLLADVRRQLESIQDSLRDLQQLVGDVQSSPSESAGTALAAPARPSVTTAGED
jgi:DNA-binding SARP family transcriptional activator